MPAKTTGYLYDDQYLDHLTGMFHPESPKRLTAINNGVSSATWYKDLVKIKAKDVDTKIISLVHDHNYISKVKRECKSGYNGLSTGDTTICQKSFTVAIKAVGGILAAADVIMSGQAKNAFCAVRPPGHHASQNQGMGFCLFNNIAILARYAQHHHDLEKILIIDWDVHHGNGTQDLFYNDNTVFFMSTHQYPWYPGTGHLNEKGDGKGKGFTLNRPLPAGTGNKEIIKIFKNDFLPAAKSFKPDLTLISAGFDSRIGDPLGNFLIDDEGFRDLTKIILEIANINGNGKLISVLEGGYNLKGLSTVVSAHLDELLKA